MHALIGSHFGPLEGKFLLITLVIERITLNAIVLSKLVNVISRNVRVFFVYISASFLFHVNFQLSKKSLSVLTMNVAIKKLPSE
jgi:hypothetical protein